MVVPDTSYPTVREWSRGVTQPMDIPYAQEADRRGPCFVASAGPIGWRFVFALGVLEIGKMQMLLLLKNVVPPYVLDLEVESRELSHDDEESLRELCMLYNPGIGGTLDRMLSGGLSPLDFHPIIRGADIRTEL